MKKQRLIRLIIAIVLLLILITLIIVFIVGLTPGNSLSDNFYLTAQDEWNLKFDDKVTYENPQPFGFLKQNFEGRLRQDPQNGIVKFYLEKLTELETQIIGILDQMVSQKQTAKNIFMATFIPMMVASAVAIVAVGPKKVKLAW